MHLTRNFTIVFFVSILLVSCDQALNKAGSLYLKKSLKDTCGEDPACVAAVEKQFGPCHSKYEADWNKYMNSSSAKEDELLKIYSEKLYSCIVDENGEPYFEYNPQ